MYNINWLIIQVSGMRLCGNYLRKRHKIRCRGTGLRRFTSEILYQQYGLYPVPTSVKWKHNAL